MVRQPAAGYDADVAGLDEARARSVLADMQQRLARDPSAALGLPAGATIEDVRAAFLRLTKQYHPVRFGRMAADIQRQANEVFLALRAAHDQISKTLRRATGPIAQAAVVAPVAAAPGNGRGGQALPSRTAHPETHDTGERPILPSAAASGLRPAAARPAAPPAAARTPGTARPAGNPLPTTARDEAAVIDLLQRQQWNLARSALHQLVARDPGSKRLRALEAYARGREAQLERRLDDARVELQDALELDPDLQLAKTALGELFTRRK